MDLETARRLCELARVIDTGRWSAIFNTAGADARRCFQEFASAAAGKDGPPRIDQFWARASVRAGFATIEAMTFDMRLGLRQALDAKLYTLPEAEASLLTDHTFELDEIGKPRARTRFLPIERAVRFAFPRFVAMFGATTVLDVSGDGWRQFCQTVKLRNRITHPKSPEDMNMDSAEVSFAMRAFTWYSETVTSLMTEIENLMTVAGSTVRANTQERLLGIRRE